MKKYWLVVILALVSGGYLAEHVGTPTASLHQIVSEAALTPRQSFEDRRSDVQVQGHGKVSTILAEDNRGSRHQRFILRLASGQTLLVAHNIDLAPRIPGLKLGDKVEFYGEYEWNAQGGVVHWTHRDPQGRHVDGWLRHDATLYH
ncbi:DUF3465 domain-containing protein [Halomonas sp. WWR20]